MSEQENKSNDYIVRGTAAEGQIRAFAITSQALTEEARERHALSPIATAALGRTMAAALMMSDMLKGEKDLLTIQIKGDGPLGGLTVTSDNHGNVKGYVQNPDVFLPDARPGHLNVGGAVGKGTLTVMRDLGLKDVYSGQIPLYSGEIAEDITHYFTESEQIPSACGLGVRVDTDGSCTHAGGFIVQMMPGAEDEVISRLEENLLSFPAVTDMLLAGFSPEDLLNTVLSGLDFKQSEREEVRFHCNCGRERVEQALMLLGKDEVRKMIDEDAGAELVCRFCGKKYKFELDEMQRILARI